MERLQAIVERISRLSVYVGGTLLLIAVGLVTFEVIARKAFNYSIAGADELSGYAYALSMTWGFAYAFHRGAHIRVDALYRRLPLVVRSVLDVISLLAFGGLFLFLTYRGYFVVEQTYDLGGRADTPMGTPLMYPQVPWLLGLAFFAFCIVLMFLRAARALVRGDLETVERVAGAGGHGFEGLEAGTAPEQGAKSDPRPGGDGC